MGERIDFLIGPWRDWRLPKTEQCEVCGKRLNRKQAVTVSSISTIRDPVFGTGGGGVTATYCKAHAPQGEQ